MGPLVRHSVALVGEAPWTHRASVGLLTRVDPLAFGRCAPRSGAERAMNCAVPGGVDPLLVLRQLGTPEPLLAVPVDVNHHHRCCRRARRAGRPIRCAYGADAAGRPIRCAYGADAVVQPEPLIHGYSDTGGFGGNGDGGGIARPPLPIVCACAAAAATCSRFPSWRVYWLEGGEGARAGVRAGAPKNDSCRPTTCLHW